MIRCYCKKRSIVILNLKLAQKIVSFVTKKRRRRLLFYDLCLGLLGATVDTDNDSMVSVVRLEGQLFLRLALGLLESVALGGVDDIRGSGGVNAIGLDGDDEVTTSLQEHVGVQSDDTGLIRLGDIGEDDVDHADQHAVAERLTGILNDRDDVRALLGHVGEVTAGSVRELNSVDNTFRADHVGDMGDGGTGGTAQVQDAGAGLDGHVADASDDGRGDLGTERIPDAVLDLLLVLLDRDALLAVDGLTDDHVAGDESIILALGNEAAFVAMGLDDHLGFGAALTFAALTFAFALAFALAFAKATLAFALAFACRFAHLEIVFCTFFVFYGGCCCLT